MTGLNLRKNGQQFFLCRHLYAGAIRRINRNYAIATAVPRASQRVNFVQLNGRYILHVERVLSLYARYRFTFEYVPNVLAGETARRLLIAFAIGLFHAAHHFLFRPI